MVQAGISANRILDFITSDDLDDYVQVNPEFSSGTGSDASTTLSMRTGETRKTSAMIAMEDASLGWMIEEAKEDTDEAKAEKEVNNKTGYKVVATANEDDIELTEPSKAVDGLEQEELVNRGLYTLSNVSFSVNNGDLVAIVGSVGSG